MRHSKHLFFLATVLILTPNLFISRVQADLPPAAIVINPDGSITSAISPVPLERSGNAYTFTNNVSTDLQFGLIVQKSDIIINGNGFTLHGPAEGVSAVYLDCVSNVILGGLNVANFGVGIFLNGTENCIISNNKFTNTTCAILLMSSSGNTVTNNEGSDFVPREDMPQIAIFAYSESRDNLIAGNAIRGSTHGIGCADAGNHVLGNVLINCTSVGVWCSTPGGTEVAGNELYNCPIGIFALSDYDVRIVNNTVTGAMLVAIAFENCSGQGYVVAKNRVGSGNVGIYINATANVAVHDNNVTDNGLGIQVLSSENITVVHNNFIDNANQALVDQSSVAWSGGYPYGGNFWSDYTGKYPNVVDAYSGPGQNEAGSDGIWDSPYVIDEHNADPYPLTQPLPPPSYTLTITAVGDGTTEPRPGSYTCEAGGSIVVTAVPAAGGAFIRWLLDGVERSENPITVYMRADHSLQAVFADITAPTVTVLSPVGFSWNNGSVPLVFAVDEPISGAWYSLDGGANVTIARNTTLNLCHCLPEGTHTLSVYANDTSGNIGVASVQFFVDRTPPGIISVTQHPADNVGPDDVVSVNATIVDYGSGVKRATLSYYAGVGWVDVAMERSGAYWTAKIPPFPQGTNVVYVITVEDNVGNVITSTELGYTLGYSVIPEFSHPAMLGLLLLATTLVVILKKRTGSFKASKPPVSSRTAF